VVATAGLVRRAHAAGLQVHVWTVDDADAMRALLDRGVDGLMTDRTDILARVLHERGLWPEQRPGTAEERSDL
jgi:glycerophosphoryl diester phosphodiesterase